MSFVLRWLLATALMPFLVAGLFTAIAAPFAGGGEGAWLPAFYAGMLRSIVTSPTMWLTMFALGLVSAQLQAPVLRRKSKR